MAEFKANSKEDVARLANLIREVKSEDRWQLAADLAYLRLMNFREHTIQSLMTSVDEVNRKQFLDHFFGFANIIEKQIIDEFIQDTINHALYGTDTEDEDSVGGWSQREIDLLINKREWQ